MSIDVTVRNEPATTREARAYWFYGDLVIVHVSGEQTDGRLCVVEFLQPPGEWTPLHVHSRSAQTQIVLEGELTVYLPGRTVMLGPGESLTTPVNVPHTECVTSAGPARSLDINVPAGFDTFVAEAGEPASELTLPTESSEPPDIERLAALAAKYEIELLGPPGALP